MATPSPAFHDATGLLNPSSITKFNNASADIPAISRKISHVTNLIAHATLRLGPSAPFAILWANISRSQSQRANLFHNASAQWTTLEAGLDPNDGVKVRNWKNAFDVTAETFSIWVRKQNEAIEREDVKGYIAEEEALIAAQTLAASHVAQ